MKAFAIIAPIFLCSLQTIFAKGFYGDSTHGKCKTIEDTLTKTTVYITADVMPKREGGGIGYLVNSLRSIIMDSIQGSYEGHFIVSFVIDTSGGVYGVRVAPAVEIGLNIPNISNILKSLHWEPGICNGKKVNMLIGEDVHIDIAEIKNSKNATTLRYTMAY